VSFRIVSAGDSGLVVDLYEDSVEEMAEKTAEKINLEVNCRAIALAESISGAQLAGVRDVVPTYRTVAVYFDPLRVDYDTLVASIEREAGRARVGSPTTTRFVRIPVCYGGELGPDLPDVATFSRLNESEVALIHAETRYRVYMLGFVAGFAYMGKVDERIAMPRHSTPRVRVPAGSVGIAGVQTGVYPAETPGGWRLIGRTPVKLFDPGRSEPFLLKAGDGVEFYAITREEYELWPSA
jgi:inhibitor of KinA